MSKELEITSIAATDGWNAITNVQSFISGNRIRYSQGDYTTTNGASLCPDDLFGVTGVSQAWQKWVDGVPETRMTLPQQPHPSRELLGDLDENLWPLGQNGIRTDPWTHVYAVYLMNLETGLEFTIVLKTIGGKRAVEELASVIQRMRSLHPRARAVISLRSEKMKTRHGSTPKPVFKIEHWSGIDTSVDNQKLPELHGEDF